MDKTGKFLLPSPKFKTSDETSKQLPHFLSPHGMLLPKEKQPPPMYGTRGSTLPPKFLSPPIVPTTKDHHEKNQKYFCEPCEAEFHTSTDYKVHKSEHTGCEIDNCSFRGHPAFMDTHIAQQHATGLYDQFKKLSTPEEIAQWKADRKKNYPTVASVIQKWKAREQRMLRGEKLEASKKRFGKHSDRRQMRSEKKNDVNSVPRRNKRKRKNNRLEKPIKKATDNLESKEKLSVEIIKTEETLFCQGVQMFCGTMKMTDYKRVKKPDKNVLSSLLGMYGSDSEETESEDEDIKPSSPTNIPKLLCPQDLESNTEGYDKESGVHTHLTTEGIQTVSKQETDKKSKNLSEEAMSTNTSDVHSVESTLHLEEPGKENEKTTQPISNHPSDVIEESPTKEKSNISEATSDLETSNLHSKNLKVDVVSDDDAPEEVPIKKTTNIPDKPENEPPRKKSKPNCTKPKAAIKSGLDYRKLRRGRQNTMLEKLLEPDIRHERNVLLQCVRFVVENNFFDPPKSGL